MATSTPSLSVDINFSGQFDPKDMPDFVTYVNNAGTITPNFVEITEFTGDTVTCKFASDISTAEQTTLSNLAGTFVPAPFIGNKTPNYDALVAADGSGDHLKPSAAFAAGAKTIYVRSGTYVETSDINIPNHGVMVGESTAPVVLYFVGAYGVKIDGSGGVKETTGTISITNNTNSVTGSGTTFTNLTVGDYLLLDQNFYQIATITDATNLTLTENYKGNPILDLDYVAQAMHTAINLSNLIIIGSTVSGLYLRAVRSTIISYVGVMNNNIGVEIVDSAANAMSTVNCYNNTSHGMCFDNSYSIGLINGESYNNGGNGYHVMGNSNNIVFNGVLANNNNGTGITITGNSTNILINDCTVKRNNGTAIITEVNTGTAVIDGSLMSYNGSDGVYFSGSDNIISNCIIGYNELRGIHAGTNGTVTGNQVFNNGTIGIDMTGDSNSQISSNNIHDNGSDGIYMNGDNNGISDNNIRSNGAKGIHINIGKDNDIDGNTIADNTEEGIKMIGACTMTIVANNRIKNNTVGVDIPSTSDDCTINGNIISGNSSHGISLGSNECIVSGNRCKGNGGDGCIILTGATSNLVKTNIFTGNTGANLTDNGTTTVTD